ncbi:MAG TPA: alkaline phosphatase family protein [Candidatus Dormibacteraeota bacterium]|nr:alkaline phosphatase family protein [Candidatus Dormibacteraeota bacterium]
MAQRPSLPRPLAVVVAALLATVTACGSSGGTTTSTSTSNGATSSAASSGVPHVMVIVMENQEYADVIASPDAPYVNQLAKQYGLATMSYARTHPSLPNYIDLIAGSTMSISSDCTDCHTDGDTLVDELNRAGVHWMAYMGGMPSVCYQGADYPPGTLNGYAKKHNPFLYFDHLRTDPTACQDDVPLSRLDGDLSSGRATPFIWVSPSLCDDGHNTDCGLPSSDKWLSSNLPAVLASSWYGSGGIVIVTWDEGTSNEACCGGGAHGGHIATLVISRSVKPGARLGSAVDHAGTLRTIEALYGVPYLRTSADPQSGDLLPLLGRPHAP